MPSITVIDIEEVRALRDKADKLALKLVEEHVHSKEDILVLATAGRIIYDQVMERLTKKAKEKRDNE